MDRKTFDSLRPGDIVRILKFGVGGNNLTNTEATVLEFPGFFDIKVATKAEGWGNVYCEPEEIELLVRIKTKYPHTCNRVGCGGDAYVGAYDVDCLKCGKH